MLSHKRHPVLSCVVMWHALLSNSHAGFGPLCVALADCALTLMETIMADLKLESLSPTAVCCFPMWHSFFRSFEICHVRPAVAV